MGVDTDNKYLSCLHWNRQGKRPNPCRSLLFLEQLGKCLMTCTDCSDKLEHSSEVYHGWPVPFFGAASLKSAAKIIAREVKYLGGDLIGQLLCFSQDPANYHTQCMCSTLSPSHWPLGRGQGYRNQVPYTSLFSNKLGMGRLTWWASWVTALCRRHRSFIPLLTSLFFCSFLYLYRYMTNIKPMHVFALVPWAILAN